MAKIEPLTINVSEDALADLWSRLENVRWPDEVAAEPWRYGPPLAYMKRFVEYWRRSYDWRAAETAMNRFDHYQTTIDGQLIHFIHEPGTGPNPTPLIMTHGWPGSFVEMLRILPMLTNPAAHGGRAEDAFSVVVPSIPGHGFSGRPTTPDVNYSTVADTWASLMSGLGYERFAAQGGDWGSWISASMARQHPGKVIGLHLNYLSTRFRPATGDSDAPLTTDEAAYVDRIAAWGEAEGGYIAIQATKPLTLGYALADTPVGLAAWMLEKFRSWSDCADVPDDAIALDDIITNIMIYWITNTAHSAARFYAGSRERPFQLAPGERITPPCAVMVFPGDIPQPPRSWAERAFNVQRWSVAERGGHFAALEEPAPLARDMRAFVRQLQRS